jgi:hypothetical protein
MTQISTSDFIVAFVTLGEITRPQEVRVVENVVLDSLACLSDRNVHRSVDLFLIFNFLFHFLHFLLYYLNKII